jgi:hypothetical protein
MKLSGKEISKNKIFEDLLSVELLFLEIY